MFVTPLIDHLHWDMRLGMACAALSAEVGGSRKSQPGLGWVSPTPSMRLCMGALVGEEVVELSRSFWGTGEKATFCGLLHHF
jgi:hypothetical protein